ncbi:Metalloenzyme, LuxS/M16 peptidase-like protein [Limtongia smithiae]|uniref:Metalloenzyme, LuxS/M16 peptidase-like protein n=1 Tax=Limtongia smithiae TaxID=1125753 RepID=UPI0034CDBDC9
MLPPSRSSHAAAAALRSAVAASAARRSFASSAAAASDSGFATAAVDGVTLAAKEFPGPISTVSFVVKAGSRYATTSGVAHALQRFAFQNTKTRSALRITRESEFLGASLSSALSRDAIVLSADFLKADLPYFFEVLADVFSRPHLARHELSEIVGPLLKLDTTLAAKDPVFVATDAVLSAAYRKGLGLPLYAQPTDSISASTVAAYKDAVYTKANLAVVGSGVSVAELSSLATDFLEDAPAGVVSPTAPSTFYGGDIRVPSTYGNAVVIATPAPTPEYAVLAAILGGSSSIKWSYGTSLLGAATPGTAYAKVLPFAGSSLFTITASVPASATETSAAAVAAVAALKSVAASGVDTEAVKKGIAASKFAALSAFEGKEGLVSTGLGLLSTGALPEIAAIASAFDGVTAAKVQSAAESIVKGKVAVSAVGKVTELPYADELF